MSQTFGALYADAYDLLYKDKDYVAECDLIESLFRRYCAKPISSVLDLGSGTGSHAFPLAARGYEVVGVDRSASMIALANRKLTDAGTNGAVAFREGDLRNIELGRQFDAAVMMFAVLGYQLSNADVLAALKTARRHLLPGGLLIFDVWYGPAVLHQRPSERVKVMSSDEGKILRVASGDLDVSHHVCRVGFRVWRLSGERLLSDTEETHAMRFFFPLELDLFLECAGFTPVRLGAFPKFDNDPDVTTWNVIGVARAV